MVKFLLTQALKSTYMIEIMEKAANRVPFARRF